MENMEKILPVPKWMLINWPKIPQIPKNLSVCPSTKVWNFDEKRASLGIRSPWFEPMNEILQK